jgi:AcrR family transcriptional regulator
MFKQIITMENPLRTHMYACGKLNSSMNSIEMVPGSRYYGRIAHDTSRNRACDDVEIDSAMKKTKGTEPLLDSSREKLIQSAERLFAERGFDGVSVRDITNDAKVNSALVGYYFRGKEGLLAEVYTRHCEPLRNERAKALADYRAGGKAPTLRQILDAFIRPSLAAGQGSEKGRGFSRLRAILSAENSSLLEQLVAQTFDETNRVFVDELCRCLPHLTREDVFWRFHFLLGAIYYTATGPYRIKTLSKGKCDPSDPVATTDELINYAVAGFQSPSGQDSTPARRQPAKKRK